MSKQMKPTNLKESSCMNCVHLSDTPTHIDATCLQCKRYYTEPTASVFKEDLYAPTTSTADSTETHDPVLLFPEPCKLRSMVWASITPEFLQKAIEQEELDEYLHLYDEIDIPINGGKNIVTIVCGRVSPTGATFVFKDCRYKVTMKIDPCAPASYMNSWGRECLYNEIYPLLSPHWQALIKPKAIEEVVDGRAYKYTDPLWLPSATEVFGPKANKSQRKDKGDAQLLIFQRQIDRIKTTVDGSPVPWVLRTTAKKPDNSFFLGVESDGNLTLDSGIESGIIPCFDI